MVVNRVKRAVSFENAMARGSSLASRLLGIPHFHASEVLRPTHHHPLVVVADIAEAQRRSLKPFETGLCQLILRN